MAKNYKEEMVSEWPFRVEVSEIGDQVRHYHAEADDEERVDLARRLGVDQIKSATADFDVGPEQGGLIPVSGTVRAEIVQTCVVTLEPLESVVEAPAEGWFADRMEMVSFAKAKKERETKKSHSEVEILDERDDPEPVINGKIDLGELAAQHLSLAIDPFPRKEGVGLEGEDAGNGQNPSPLRKNPFEALKDWKERR